MLTQQDLRSQVIRFFDSITPKHAVEFDTLEHENGVTEFTRNWLVRDGLFASLSDHDDTIEFGLVERCNGNTNSLLQATLILDEDAILFNCISEADDELNFDLQIDDEKSMWPVFMVMQCFHKLHELH